MKAFFRCDYGNLFGMPSAKSPFPSKKWVKKKNSLLGGNADLV